VGLPSPTPGANPSPGSLCRAIRFTCGARAATVVGAAEEWCCGRPNPAAQLLYVFCVGGGWWLFAEHCYPLLPGPGASAYHRRVLHPATAMKKLRIVRLGFGTARQKMVLE
jgi:hypothetical protein